VSTTAPQLLAIAYAALDASEQEDAYALIAKARLKRIAGEDSDTSRLIRSMQRVMERIGHPPTVDEYRSAQIELEAAGEDIAALSQFIRHFGSWARAKEALALAEVTTPRRIQARFDSRRVDKIWRYSDETLRETVARCAEHYGRVPMVSEFAWWRDRELELARAAGEKIHLPSASPYRRRWGTWEAALMSFGYSDAAVAQRLEPGHGE
jgi:hypothetical protein